MAKCDGFNETAWIIIRWKRYNFHTQDTELGFLFEETLWWDFDYARISRDFLKFCSKIRIIKFQIIVNTKTVLLISYGIKYIFLLLLLNIQKMKLDRLYNV